MSYNRKATPIKSHVVVKLPKRLKLNNSSSGSASVRPTNKSAKQARELFDNILLAELDQRQQQDNLQDHCSSLISTGR